MKHSTRRKRLAIGVGAGLIAIFSALVSAWAFGLILHDTSQAASVKQALRDFRASGHGNGGLNGVYLYATDGRESIDALGGASHTYPATTTVTAIEVPCGVQLRWSALTGRSTTWTFCSTPAGTVLRSSDERHSFFGQRDHTTYICTGRMLLPKTVQIGAVYPFSCNAKSASETGDMHVLGRDEVVLGKSRVQALHVRSTLTIHGGNAGHESIDWWLDPASTLPLRIVMKSRTSRSIYVGTVHYHENFSLRLLSLHPRR